MNIVLISPGLLPKMGGAAFSEAALTQALSQSSRVTILVPQDRWDLDMVQAHQIDRVVRPYSTKELLHSWVSRTQNSLEKLIADADVVHFNGHWSLRYYIFSLLCRRYLKTYVVQPRGMYWLGHRSRLKKILFNALVGNQIVQRSSKIIALSELEKRLICEQGIKPEKVEVIPNGISQVEIATGQIVGGYPFETDPFFLYLGRIEARKNLVFLIHAFANYQKQGGRAKLALVGPVERNYDKRILETARACLVQESVKICPPLYGKQKWQWLSQALAMVYPAQLEVFGRAAFESICAGTPPILPWEGGGTEYLKPFLSDCFYTQGKPDELAQRLRYVEIHRNSLGQPLGRAQQWIHQSLSWDRIALQLQEVFRASVNPLQGL